ncbi:MAG: hypothetical protein EBY39_10975 [Flavobacteriia bacterium]|nr:hypothetical protein [Flavobacteriia bacterium]
MVEKHVVEFVIVPPEFGILFVLPMIGAYLLFRYSDNLFWPSLFYFSSQIGLALLAHNIYG